jgi:hypothetical protein
VLERPRVKALLSDEQFSVDGTLIEAGAGMKSFHAKGGSGAPPDLGRNGARASRGEKCGNQTFASWWTRGSTCSARGRAGGGSHWAVMRPSSSLPCASAT